MRCWRERLARGISTTRWLVAVWLWDQWSRSLEPVGIDRESFLDIVVAYRRELWLWLMGERGWEPFVTGLAGRVARRLPAA